MPIQLGVRLLSLSLFYGVSLMSKQQHKPTKRRYREQSPASSTPQPGTLFVSASYLAFASSVAWARDIVVPWRDVAGPCVARDNRRKKTIFRFFLVSLKSDVVVVEQSALSDESTSKMHGSTINVQLLDDSNYKFIWVGAHSQVQSMIDCLYFMMNCRWADHAMCCFFFL